MKIFSSYPCQKDFLSSCRIDRSSLKRFLSGSEFWPCVIFIFSLLLRLSLMSKGPYNSDTLDWALKAEEFWREGVLAPHTGLGYPLTVLLGALFLGGLRFFSFDDPVMAVNLVSVVFGALTVYALYRLIQELFGEKAAILGSILLSINPLFLGVSVYGKNHAISMYFLLLGLFSLIKYQSKGKISYLWLSAIIFGLMSSARIVDFATVIIPISFFLFFRSSVQRAEKKFFDQTGSNQIFFVLRNRRRCYSIFLLAAIFFGTSKLSGLLFH